MKKTLLILCTMFLLTGCEKGEDITCNIKGKEAIFTLKKGVVVGYKLEGKRQLNSEIAEINGEYFTSATNNEEGKIALQTYINSLGGTCN